MISAEAKVKLYKVLLKLFGVGAKTNVGYGILKDYDPNRDSQPVASQRSEQNKSFNQTANTSNRPEARGVNATQSGHHVGNPTGAGVGSITEMKCPYCKYVNHKYKRNPDRTLSTQIHEDWKKKKCHGCGRRLDLE